MHVHVAPAPGIPTPVYNQCSSSSVAYLSQGLRSRAGALPTIQGALATYSSGQN